MMNISEMIDQLQALKDEHGDLKVFHKLTNMNAKYNLVRQAYIEHGYFRKSNDDAGDAERKPFVSLE